MPTRKDGETEQIVISGMPRKLRERIDALAQMEKRSRAKQIVVMLEEIVAGKMAAAEVLR
jgi:hypothetical protein